MEVNVYFIAIFAITVGFYLLDLLANVLNLSALRDDLPGEFQDSFDREAYRKSQQYTRVTTRFGFIESTFALAVFLAFWLLGGFGWLDGFIRGMNLHPVMAGLVFISLLWLANRLLTLPFDLYDTFVIEERFGFNKTTPKTFAMDEVKGLLVGAAIGWPILAVLLSLFQYGGELAWLYGWIVVAGFSLLLTYFAPRLLLPLFNKFTPLDDGELKDAILAMAERTEFPLAGIEVMDGSRRSSKSNAFFTGFGKNKKIALFDTLVAKHTVQELVGVLAHEIGHFKLKHILQHLAFGLAQMGVLFFLAGFFIRSEGLCRAFGVSAPTVYAGFVFFLILFRPISKLLGIVGGLWSRKHEFEADAFAANATRRPGDLVDALKKLSRDNLSNLTPHPFYVFLYYSHPPMLERIEAIRGGDSGS